MPEVTSTTPEHRSSADAEVALQAAGSRVAELGFDPAFQAYLAETYPDTTADDPETYWAATTGYVDQLLTTEQLSDVERDSLAIAGYLPEALLNKYYLDQYGTSMDSAQRRHAKEVVCTYNGLLKHYVTSHPLPVDVLHHSLLSITLETIGAESVEFSNHADRSLRDICKGIKHEIGFAQILSAFPPEVINYREATVAEDLKGKDLIIHYKGRDIGIDVKASLSEVDAKNRGSNGTPIATKPSGDLVVFSMLRDADFRGGFQPNPSRIAEIAPMVGGLLQRALDQSIAK